MRRWLDALRAWWSLRHVGRWRRLSIDDRDVLVFEIPQALRIEEYRNLRDTVRTAMRLPAAEVVVLEGGIRLVGAIRRGLLK